MVAVQDMEVRAAHTDDSGPHSHFSRTRLRFGCRYNLNLTRPSYDNLTHLLSDVHAILLSAISGSPLLLGRLGKLSVLDGPSPSSPPREIGVQRILPVWHPTFSPHAAVKRHLAQG